MSYYLIIMINFNSKGGSNTLPYVLVSYGNLQRLQLGKRN